MGKRLYFDWASTAIPVLFDACISEEERGVFGNPSSIHEEGRRALKSLENSRSHCAEVLKTGAEKLCFTSGGTESNAIMLHSLLLNRGKGRLLYSPVEHPSVRENCIVLEKLGLPVSLIGVEKDGRISEASLSRALEKNPDTRFAAIMGVNNETGALMDLAALVSLIRKREEITGLPIHIHADLVQALGKVNLDISKWDLDSAAFSAHKLGGPRGIGLLYIKKPVKPLNMGGGQERNMRPGTENTPGAAAFAKVLERYAKDETVWEEEAKAEERMAYLIGKLKGIKRCTLIPEDREERDKRFSPWILQAAFRDVPGQVMVRALDDSGIAVSTGSACSSNSPERPVLEAMGIDENVRLEGIRFSQGWTTEKDDMDVLVAAIEKVLSFL